MKKRGLSEVVTAVLLVLLVIVSSIIIWRFFLPLLTQGGKSVLTTSSCISLDLQPIACKINHPQNNSANVTYKWAGGNVNITSVKLILESTDGDQAVKDGPALSLLETRTVTADFGEGKVASKFTVAGVVRLENGDTVTCSEAPNKVDCR